MKSAKIKNNGSGFYSVTVAAGSMSNTYDFNSHKKLTLFINHLKKDGYVIVNDQY